MIDTAAIGLEKYDASLNISSFFGSGYTGTPHCLSIEEYYLKFFVSFSWCIECNTGTYRYLGESVS